MKLWSIQPSEVAQKLLQGESYTCKPDLSFFADENAFQDAYNWIFAQMAEKVPKPEGVEHGAWAWFKNYGKEQKPKSWRGVFKYCTSNDVILELEVPEDAVLLSDFTDWHCVLNDSALISEEQYALDPERVFSQEEKVASWQQIFNIGSKDFVQACLWQIKPEHLVKVHRARRGIWPFQKSLF